MERKTNIIAILALILIVFSVNAFGQSLKGRIWQTQDSTEVRTRPTTLVLKPDGTFYQLEYYFNDNMKLYNYEGGFEEGTYTETKTTLSLTRYIGANNYPPVTYKITWLNNSEFILPIGVRKYHFAELGSDVDIFTTKYLIPFIKDELRNKHKINPCYLSLVDQINAANQRQKEEAVSSSKLIRKSSLVGTIWQMQVGNNREERGRLNNISFGEDGMMSEIAFVYEKGSITKTDGERKKAYREEASGIVTFNDKGTISTPLEIKWENENQLIIDGYYYARFNSDKDLFSKNYTYDYVKRLLDSAQKVYPSFLELFTENLRNVAGKVYSYDGDDISSAPYKSFEFSYGNECSAYSNKFISLQLKYYNYNYSSTSTSISLRFCKRSLLSFNSNKAKSWDEKWELKWLNSQEFLLIEDDKSFRYKLQGMTPDRSVAQ